ncbi:ABC transporter ATP-binding protein [Sphingobacterium hungaricum]|uniref:ABC transporter ATP-binding protein n=1 Tax=Sphingobacterium hungaricum TaxID=2082723 RepID=A0A928UVV5_9SPHI|nr:ABC transporter ATP-binding protein [Sphingobacterium hungaricum]MBE8713903.1 ABC transporter ATP-binding protein [Sphingobacterium hungaricum]
MSSPIIHIEKLYKRYRHADFYSVEDINLDVHEKEVFGLLGPNGAGKTTLISLLCGLIQPTSGSFTINGFNYSESPMDLKKSIGVVSQEYALYPTLTARENLVYFGSMNGLRGDYLYRLVDESLERMDLGRFAKKQVETFSGGMKRRVNLLAGTLHNPKVLFLDEPTVGVDVKSKNTIITYLKELNQQGTTLIYTSHHMVEAQELCTRIAFIESGKLVKQGTPSDLIASVDDARNLEDVFIDVMNKGEHVV